MHLTAPELGFLVCLWLAMAALTYLLAGRFGLARGLWLAVGLVFGVLAPFLMLLWTRTGGAIGAGGGFERVEPHWPGEEREDSDDWELQEPHGGEAWERREPRAPDPRGRREPRGGDDWERPDMIEPPPNRRSRQGRPVPPALGDEMKKCPRCAELVRVDALVCRFCGNEFQRSAEIRPIRPDFRRR